MNPHCPLLQDPAEPLIRGESKVLLGLGLVKLLSLTILQATQLMFGTIFFSSLLSMETLRTKDEKISQL